MSTQKTSAEIGEIADAVAAFLEENFEDLDASDTVDGTSALPQALYLVAARFVSPSWASSCFRRIVSER